MIRIGGIITKDQMNKLKKNGEKSKPNNLNDSKPTNINRQ